MPDAVHAARDDLHRQDRQSAAPLRAAVVEIALAFAALARLLARTYAPVVEENFMQLRHCLAFEPHKGVAPEAERPLALVLSAEVEPAREADRAVDYDDFAVVAEIHLAAE